MGVDYYCYASTWNRYCDPHFNSTVMGLLAKPRCSGWSMLKGLSVSRYWVVPGICRSYSPNITWMYSLLTLLTQAMNFHIILVIQAAGWSTATYSTPAATKIQISPKMVPENAHARPCRRVITSMQLPKLLLIFQLSISGRNLKNR